MGAQVVQDHVANKKCKKCSQGSIADLVKDKDRLQRFGASLQVYSTCKQALAKPQELNAGQVPPESVKLAKNCAAAIFQASNLSDKSEYRYGILCGFGGNLAAQGTWWHALVYSQ